MATEKNISPETTPEINGPVSPLDMPFKSAKQTGFDQVVIQIASPDVIRSWSHGEVKKPETINYRTYKPETGGLFCQRIFGPVKDWECACGKYKRIKYRGIVCERCGVEVAEKSVRRQRMGHIELAAPVAHIWFFKINPSRIGTVLDIPIKKLERVIYFEDYIVLDPGKTELKKFDLINEMEYDDYVEKHGSTFEVGMGAEAIKRLLIEQNLDEIAEQLYEKIHKTKSSPLRKKIAKRLKVIEGFRQSTSKCEHMILEAIPIIPPDLRPLVPLDGGRFATSDLNDLYRRVINRNNRLKLLLSQRTPEVIIRNEKRMLQEAVDALIDNGRHGHVVTGTSNRPLKSLSENLKGKQGRFRQNLLGKRVDYSGRSVIVIGPELKIHQCGLPKKMALELFQPFVASVIVKSGMANSVKAAKKLLQREPPEVWDILEEVTKGHTVMLNRAPTLHRLGIQAFEPVLIEGNAIRVHPLVCTAFNADFDGDQMAVHVPLSKEAQWESKNLMLATNNIYSPASGKAIMTPTQDIVLGIYYLTKDPWLKEHLKSKVGVLTPDEVHRALDNDAISLHTEIKVMFPDSKKPLITTAGRVIFNEALPDEIEFVNHTVNKKELGKIVSNCYKTVGQEKTVETLDNIKELGFHISTIAGISISMYDMAIPETKAKTIAKANKTVQGIVDQYAAGLITEDERKNMIQDEWTHFSNKLASDLFERISVPDIKAKELNPLHMMVDSGARGSKDQIRQLAAMRGLMAKPSGEIIETPITSNFKEGLSVLEYFISTHGARKGLADTALKTADAGYLTRRLVDVSQDVIITVDDCGTPNGIKVSAIEEGNEVKVTLSERITGRVAVNDVHVPGSKELLFKAGEMITEEKAQLADDYNISSIAIRSALTCEAKFGMCAKCYGMDLARQKLIELGMPVGIIAAQSIGEPGTQLTMRTFHIGGTASAEVTKPYHDAGDNGYVKIHNVKTVKTDEGELTLNKNGFISLHAKDDREIAKYPLVIGAVLSVKDGDKVKKGQRLVKWDPYNISIYTEKQGVVEYRDIKDGVTMKRERNEKTGKVETVILETRENLRPEIIIKDPNSSEPLSYQTIPANAHIVVADGELVKAGALIAKMPRKASMTKDITGGLPRVEELFEARIPKEAAEIAKIDGVIEFREGITNGKRKVVVKNETTAEELEHLIPLGKHLVVSQGENVRKGQQLTEGAVNPHDLLAICGVKELQSYLLDQIQEVYRSQGVIINDKHIEVIVRQMLRKVQITDTGDSSFLFGEDIEIGIFNKENNKVAAMDPPGRPAKGSPVLQGITKAGLSTASFISAASFQETTRVLTEAAATGRKDPLLGFKENIIMGHIVPAGTGFSIEHFRRGADNIDELYVGRVKPADTLPAFLSVDDDEEDTGISDVEGIIQSVTGYVPDSNKTPATDGQ